MHEEENKLHMADFIGGRRTNPKSKSGKESNAVIDPDDFPLLSELLQSPPGEFKKRMDELSTFARASADRPKFARALQLAAAVLGEMYRNKT